MVVGGGGDSSDVGSSWKSSGPLHTNWPSQLIPTPFAPRLRKIPLFLAATTSSRELHSTISFPGSPTVSLTSATKVLSPPPAPLKKFRRIGRSVSIWAIQGVPGFYRSSYDKLRCRPFLSTRYSPPFQSHVLGTNASTRLPRLSLCLRRKVFGGRGEERAGRERQSKQRIRLLANEIIHLPLPVKSVDTIPRYRAITGLSRDPRQRGSRSARELYRLRAAARDRRRFR